MTDRVACPSPKVLSLVAPDFLVWDKSSVHFSFPRLQVLEIAQSNFPLQPLLSFMPVLHQIATTLRQMVIRPSQHARAAPPPLGTLAVLVALESSLPDLTEIHWLHPLDPPAFVLEMSQWKLAHAGAMPQLHKIRFAHCLALETPAAFHVLLAFPALEELLLSARLHILPDSVFDDKFISRQLTGTHLAHLRRLTLRHTCDDGRQLVAPLTGFHGVFASMPLLEEINLGTLAVPLSAFAHVPRLRTLSMRFVGAVHDDQSRSMEHCFPSLTSLSIPSDPASRVFYSAVRQMPQLRTVQIRDLTPRPKDDFIRDGLAVYAALEAESAKLESVALKTTGWMQTLGSSETAAAATAVVHASDKGFVEWKPAEPSVQPGATTADNAFVVYLNNKPFSADRRPRKGHKCATASAEPPPSSAPFSFGPSLAAAPIAFPAFDFSSVSSALPAPSSMSSSFAPTCAGSF